MANTLLSAGQTATERGFIHELFIQQLEVREAEDGRTVVRGKAQEAESVNRNGRLYPRAILEREVHRMAQELDRRPGAVDHPEDWTASVSRLGLRFTQLWMEGNDVLFEAEVIPTQAGRDLEAVVRSGIEVGISSRGYGTVRRETRNGREVMVLQDDYLLITFDAVTDPSVVGARIGEIESVDLIALLSYPSFQELVDRAARERMMDQHNPTGEPEPESQPAAETAEASGTQPSAEAEALAAQSEAEPTTVAAPEPQPAHTCPGAEEQVRALRDRLEAVEADARDAQAAIAAIVNIMTAELSDQNFYSVSYLADIAAYLKYRYGSTEAEAALSEGGYQPLIDGLKSIVARVAEQTLAEFIDQLVVGERFATPLAEHLKKTCRTRAEVQARFEDVKALVTSMVSDLEPSGKGIVRDPEPVVKEHPTAALARAARVIR